jgi:hypothetical protein
MHAASSLLDVMLEFPRTKGNEIANVRAEHFEVAVQNVIDASKMAARSRASLLWCDENFALMERRLVMWTPWPRETKLLF